MTASFPRLLRAAGALWIILALIWLPFEDTAIWMAVVLAATGCLWFWWRLLAKPASPRLSFVSGALLGAGTPLFAIILMALKSGLHGHGFADFTARQVLVVLNLLPIIFLVGIILGLLSFFLLRSTTQA